VGWSEFFRLSPAASNQNEERSEGTTAGSLQGTLQNVGAESSSSSLPEEEAGPRKEGDAAPPVPPAPFVQPLYISKLNTFFQLCLIAGCIGNSWYDWPPQDVLWTLGGVTGVTTLGSFIAYIRVYRQGKLLSS